MKEHIFLSEANQLNYQMQGPVGARTIINGREVDYFSGTGYLGLQSHPDVIRAMVETASRYGLSTATSRGSFGEHAVYDDLEQAACAFFGAEKVLYFPSGYMGASVLTQAASAQFDHIFIDSAAHFSLWDAAQATNLPITPFHHLQPQALADALKRELRAGERPLLLSDGVFPISGEIAPLPAYFSIMQNYAGQIYLDDAHSVGVLGTCGRGTPEYFDLQAESSIRTCGTLAKALGGYGGVVWGSAAWIDAIERGSRICIGASPPPLVTAAASAAALKVALVNPGLREKLWANGSRARSGFCALGWDLPETPVPILCLEARTSISLEALQSGLFARGIAVSLVRGYTSTPAGGALRIAIFSTHTFEQIDRLLGAVKELLPSSIVE